MSSKQYKYQDLKKDLKKKISRNEFGEKGKIDSELSLCERFDLSRNTVRQAIKELEVEGYLYRIRGKGTFVRQSHPKDSKKVALILYDSAYFSNEITAGLIREIGSFFDKQGYNLDILLSKGGFREENLSKFVKRYDGFLIGAWQIDDMILKEIEKAGIPYLFVKNYLPGTEHPAAIIDYEEAGFLVAEHLISTGASDLSLVYSGDEIAISRDFKTGVSEACLENGARLCKENIFIADFSESSSNSITEKILAMKKRPDGVICHTDKMAASLISELQNAGLKIPKDISITGCNNTQISRIVTPALTTIDIPMKELSELSGEILLNSIKNKKPTERKHRKIKPELIIRSSTKQKS